MKIKDIENMIATERIVKETRKVVLSVFDTAKYFGFSVDEAVIICGIFAIVKEGVSRDDIEKVFKSKK